MKLKQEHTHTPDLKHGFDVFYFGIYKCHIISIDQMVNSIIRYYDYIDIAKNFDVNTLEMLIYFVLDTLIKDLPSI